MPLAYFLQIDGITGGASQAQFKNQIEVTAFNVSVAVPIITSGSGGSGAGKATFSSFTFTKPQDVASLQLFAAVTAGKHFAQATLTGIESTNATQPRFHIKLTDVLVAALHINATSAVAEESISLSYGKLDWTVAPQNPIGIASSLAVGFDVVKGFKL